MRCSSDRLKSLSSYSLCLTFSNAFADVRFVFLTIKTFEMLRNISVIVLTWRFISFCIFFFCFVCSFHHNFASYNAVVWIVAICILRIRSRVSSYVLTISLSLAFVVFAFFMQCSKWALSWRSKSINILSHLVAFSLKKIFLNSILTLKSRIILLLLIVLALMNKTALVLFTS